MAKDDGAVEGDICALRTPVICVLGHVDHGKTTFLDSIRGSSVVSKEAGAITQHIGATEVLASTIRDRCASLTKTKFTLPGLLFIDTPGHHAFITLRKRGGTLADLAVLVIDILEGFKPQTIESLNILKQQKTPFVLVLNKIDKINGWRTNANQPFVTSYELQSPEVKHTLDEHLYSIINTLYEYGINADRYDHIRDFTKNVAVIPISAKTGEGIPDVLMVLMGLAQRYLEDTLNVCVSGPGVGTILEVKEERGFGVTLDVILYDGTLSVGDTIVLMGKEDPIVTRIRALLKPRPMSEIRAGEGLKKVNKVVAASGVKIVAPKLENALAGTMLRAVGSMGIEEAIEKLKSEIEEFELQPDQSGVVVKADAIGSLEAVVNELRREGIMIRSASVGDVSKKDVVVAEVGDDPLHNAIIGFNVKVLPAATEEARNEGVKLFMGDVIYSLVNDYKDWVNEQRELIEKKAIEDIIKPAKITLLPHCVFRQSKPAIVGVRVLMGTLKTRVPLIKVDGTRVGRIKGMQLKGENCLEARAGDEVAVSIDNVTVGRQIKEGDVLYVDVPENHAKVLEQEIFQFLKEDEKDALNELLEIKRANNPFWGK
ncbi:MAG: translation initiation factor IF-2 [Methermicoccaceae archaeon]